MHSILGGWEIAGTHGMRDRYASSPIRDRASVSATTRSDWAAATPTVRISTAKSTTSRRRSSGLISRSSPHQLPAWAGGLNQGFGNAGKDSIVGPGRVNFNTSLYKTFAITERVHFEFRAESFNTFNHTQFNGSRQQFRQRKLWPGHQHVGPTHPSNWVANSPSNNHSYFSARQVIPAAPFSFGILLVRCNSGTRTVVTVGIGGMS